MSEEIDLKAIIACDQSDGLMVQEAKKELGKPVCPECGKMKGFITLLKSKHKDLDLRFIIKSCGTTRWWKYKSIYSMDVPEPWYERVSKHIKKVFDEHNLEFVPECCKADLYSDNSVVFVITIKNICSSFHYEGLSFCSPKDICTYDGINQATGRAIKAMLNKKSSMEVRRGTNLALDNYEGCFKSYSEAF